MNAAGGTPTVGLIDAAPQIDSSGYDGRYGRSDGMHVDYERAELFAAEVLGPALLALLSPGDARTPRSGGAQPRP